MRALALVALALLAGCGSNPPAGDGVLTASWTRVEVLDNGEPSGPVTYALDCWNATDRRTVAVGEEVTSQVLRLAPGMWTCQVVAISPLFGTSDPSGPKSKLIR